MKATKRLGIWMDHAVARLMEYNIENFNIQTITPDSNQLDHQEKAQHSESLLHNKESQVVRAYYNSLIAVIKDYDEVVLFGPTTAKTELFNLIREEHKYDKIKIETKTAGKMSFEEQHVFILDYFKKALTYDNPFGK
ncbi:hypothetical protein WFZ85_06620 [Flavobacterium sp. j3]|uniref:Uncharacterized protein n=1 Tax=Flavobacterium aureirubrum TaxID=3133147 RepID=A0ABU9N8M4_9FLAO